MPIPASREGFQCYLKDALPEAIEPILLRCLSKDRSARYQSMRDLASTLRRAATTAQ